MVTRSNHVFQSVSALETGWHPTIQEKLGSKGSSYGPHLQHQDDGVRLTGDTKHDIMAIVFIFLGF